MMKKLLWISPYAPYDKVGHAGGKTHNYYVKYLKKSGGFDIHLISLCLKKEEEWFDLDAYGISNDIMAVDKTPFQSLFRMVYNINSVYNRKHPLCHTILSYQYHCLKKMVTAYSRQHTPDIVIMQWTGAAFLLPVVKQLFPGCKTVIVEEDVAFLGFWRRYEEATDPKQKRYYQELYKLLKQKELQLLSAGDHVIVNNPKDRKLLVENGIKNEKIYVAAPYYDNYIAVRHVPQNRDILFYGSMEREENHKAALWLIREVLPQVQNMGVRVVVIGNHPREELKKLESEQVLVKGFVEDVATYFAQGLCLAAPLQLGAGIKVKILEALSAGIPVLTNEIGIEGIPAKDKEQYYNCRTPEEYAKVIRLLCEDVKEGQRISENEKRFMKETYDIEKRLDGLITILQNM